MGDYFSCSVEDSSLQKKNEVVAKASMFIVISRDCDVLSQFTLALKLSLLQFPPLNRITLGQHKSDNNIRMFQLTDVFMYFYGINVPAIFDYKKRLILLSVIQLSGGHCITNTGL
jgi:hypothetical protein